MHHICVVRSTLLVLVLSACGTADPMLPRPFCTTIDVGDTFPREKVDGALTVMKSPLSPTGMLKRFVDQTVLVVDVTAAAGPNCKAVEAYFVTFDWPPIFLPRFFAGGPVKLYADEVSPAKLLIMDTHLGTQFGLETSLIVQPGQTRHLILTVDSTFYEPGTMGKAALDSLGWRIAGNQFNSGYTNLDAVLPISGNPVSFTTTMVDVCTPVEDKVTAMNFPLTGWSCHFQGGTPVQATFLIYAPPDQKTCRLGTPGFGAPSITASQIVSTMALTLTTDDGMTIQCTHP